MRGRAVVVACGCLGALLLGACGRLGYELLGGDGDDRMPPSAGAGGDGEAGMDGGRMPPGASMDAAVDDGSLDASLADAADGAWPPVDAGDSDDAGSETPDTGADADAGGCTPAAITDYCSQVPPLPDAPLIDGVLDCGPPLLDLTPVGWTSMMSSLPASVNARLAIAWRPDGLYVFVDVTDDTRLPPPAGADVWCGDGIELYVDDNGSYAGVPLYDDPGSIQVLAMAPVNDDDAVTSGGERYRSPNSGLVGPWSSPRYGAFPRPGGYTFEAFVQADDLDLASWSLAAGGAVGFDVSINVSTSADPPPPGEVPGCGLRLGQYFMRVAEAPCGANACEPYINAAAFCNPVLQ